MNLKAIIWKCVAILIVLAGPAACAAPSQQPSLLPPSPSVVPTAQSSPCPQSDISSMGVLKSTDHGATWTSVGKACIQGLNGLLPVDPTPLVVDGRIVIYFVDLGHLNQPVPQNIYRITSADGVNFDAPRPAYTRAETMVDPFILQLPNGSYRLYVPSGQSGMISALSTDSVTFTLEGSGNFGNLFGMPGLILLPDNRIRFFGSDHPEPGWIGSLISDDGLTFILESGERIQMPPGYLYINNPEPVRLMDGNYLMLYQIQDTRHEGRPDWMAEIHLATSTDGFTWTPDPEIIGYGGTSCVVEAPDGTLFIYYGTQ
jgi:hypothetical protein